MNRAEGFQPNWTSAPGETIIDILEERRISAETFGHGVGLTTSETNDLLQGRLSITIDLARKLTVLLGASVEFWVTRDYHYRQDSRKHLLEDERWLRKLPLGDMIRFGWLSPPPRPSEELVACLGFFGVSSVGEWQERYGCLTEAAAFRSSPSLDSREESVAAWLRQGEIEADEIDCEPWNSEWFQQSLIQLRSLTRQKDPKRFIPALQRACSECGVAVVVVRSPNGCRASGATRFVTSERAILQLSFRYLTDDHFWFTFFHEAGHLILHGLRRYFVSALGGQNPWILEGNEIPTTEEEHEANEFAATTLIPREYCQELATIIPSHREVVQFAHRVGVSPGVVVGQLQHNGRIGFEQLNGLKRRFTWQAQ